MSLLSRLIGSSRVAPAAPAQRVEPRLIAAESRAALHPSDPALRDWLMGAGFATASGAWVTPETASRCPTVSACVALLSDTIATIPLDLFRRDGDSGRTRLTEDPLHRLAHDQPNSWQSSVDFRRWLMNSLCYSGAAYARIDQPGRVTAIEPLEARRVTPFRANGAVWFRHQPKTGGAEILAADEVLYVRGRYPLGDGLLCESPVTRHRDLIGQAMAVAEYMGRFFANGAVPRGALKFPEMLDDPVATKMREQWEARHQGVAQSNRVAILDGFDWLDIASNNTDAQAVEIMSRLDSMIAGRVYMIPLHMIGEVDKSTSWGSGIEQQSIGFIVFCVRQYLVTIEAALNRFLLTEAQRRAGLYFEFNVDGLLRGDFKTQMEGYALMVQWGLATPNEIRRRLNLPAIDGGDSRLQPLNMAPAERIMDVLLKPSPAARRALDLILDPSAAPNPVPGVPEYA